MRLRTKRKLPGGGHPEPTRRARPAVDLRIDVRLVVGPGTGAAIELGAGDAVRIVDLDGGQVGDLFAFVAGNPAEHLSASHTRSVLSRMLPKPGEAFVTNCRNPILVLESDDSPGVHDMLIAACDRRRYQALGAGDHRSCADNLIEAYPAAAAVPVPQPVNLFMAVQIGPDGSVSLGQSPTKAGDSVTLRAVQACTVVVSSCPQDIVPISRNGVTRLGVEVSS